MKLSKAQLDLKDGITKEWLITNGIGGYGSSTVLGINTRKYYPAPSGAGTVIVRIQSL